MGQALLYCSTNIVYLFVWFIRVGVVYWRAPEEFEARLSDTEKPL